MKHIFLCLVTLSCWFAPQDRITSAYKAVQKGEYEKARVALEKQQEKTPDVAALQHVWAYYFFAENNKNFSIDSAYLTIQQAIKLYPSANPKDLKEWAEDSLTLATAKTLKSEIEVYAYRIASKKTAEQNAPDFLQTFINNFPTAPQIPEATLLRNETAWKVTEKANTIEAYQGFLTQYPNTAFQKKAIEKRDRLVFERETKAGTLNAYQTFIKNYAGKNLYVPEAVETLYPLYTASYSREVCGYFWNEYKAYPTAKKAWYQLFQHYKSQKKIQEFEDIFAHLAYNQEFEVEAWQEAQKYSLFPFYERELYGYLNEKGKISIEPNLENILPKHLCQTQQTDYIQVQQNTHFGLRSVVGRQVFPAEYDAFQMLAPTVWRVNKNGFYGVLHETGKEILPLRYDAVEMLGQQLLKFKKNRRWGIATLHGQVLFEPTCLEIDIKQNALIVLKQANGFTLYKIKDFWKQLQEKSTPQPFEVESLETLDSLRFIYKKNGNAGIINTRLDIILPAQRQEIRYITNTAFAIRKDSLSWSIYSLNGVPLLKENDFIKVEGNYGYLLLKKGKTWGVLQTNNAQLRHPFELDSVAMLDKVLLLYKNKKLALDGLESTEIKPIDGQGFKHIRVENGFIFYENAQQQKGLYNLKGYRICAPAYQSIYPLTSVLFNVQANGKYGIVDSAGKAILPLKYDGIDTQTPTQYALISNGKYGLYDSKENIIIEALYDQTPQILAFSSKTTAMLAAKGGQKGLLDTQNKTIVPFQYKEILAWQDSIALVQTLKGEWLFYNFMKKTKGNEKKEHTSPAHFQEVKLLATENFHTFLQVKQHDLWGIWDNQTGEKIKYHYNTIENRGTGEKPFYFAEKKLAHNRYLVTYINKKGEKIWEKELAEHEYERLVCE